MLRSWHQLRDEFSAIQTLMSVDTPQNDVAAASIASALFRHIELVNQRRADERDATDPLVADEFVYCADTDLVKVHINPSDLASLPKRKKGRGYFDFVPSLSKTTAIELSAATTNFIFYKLSKRPILVLPSVAAELKIIASELLDRAQGEQERLTSANREFNDRIKCIESLYRDRPAAATEQLIEEAPAFASFLRGDGFAFFELQRLARLVSEKRIMVYSDFFDNLTNSEADCLIASANLADVAARVRFNTTAANYWPVMLRRSMTSKKKSAASKRDAETLAYIETLNLLATQHSLQELSKGGRGGGVSFWRSSKSVGARARFVLITGDANIVGAAAAHCRDEGIESFVRWPRTYVTAPRVLDLAADVVRREDFPGLLPDSFEEWLLENVSTLESSARISFLSAAAQRESSDVERNGSNADLMAFRERIWSRAEQESFRFKTTDIVGTLEEYIRYLAADRQSEEIGNAIRSGKTNLAIQTFRRLVEKNEESVNSGLLDIWRRLLTRSAIRSVLHLLIAHENENLPHRARNAPVLLFEEKPLAQDLVLHLQRSYSGGEYSTSDLVERLQRIEAEGEYFFFLTTGVLFALESQWKLALQMGQSALHSKGVHATDEISGREAHYLCATAYRHLADGDRGLQLSRLHLKHAEECRLVSSSELHDAVSRLRFATQRIAIDATDFQRQFLDYCGPFRERGRDPIHTESREKIVESGHLVEKSDFNAAISEALPEAREILVEVVKLRLEEDRNFSSALVVAAEQAIRDLQIIVLLYYIALRCLDARFAGYDSELLSLVDDVESRSANEGVDIPVTFHTLVVCGVARYISLPDTEQYRSDRIGARNRTLDLLRSNRNESCRRYEAMQYDSKKFALFESLLNFY